MARTFQLGHPLVPGELAAVRRMTNFRHLLRVMATLDGHTLLAAGVISPNDLRGHGEQNRFTRYLKDPYKFLINADDESAYALWLLVEQQAEKQIIARRCLRSPGDLRGSCLACGADSNETCMRPPTEAA